MTAVLSRAPHPPESAGVSGLQDDLAGRGLTWSAPSVIAKHSAAHLCEPGIFRSPDGKQLAVLLRENSRKYNSFVIFSDDEGETWSVPKETPASLTGDRHTGRYSKDGRLFISFRDTTHVSPTKGDWVGLGWDLPGYRGRQGRPVSGQADGQHQGGGLRLSSGGASARRHFCHDDVWPLDEGRTALHRECAIQIERIGCAREASAPSHDGLQGGREWLQLVSHSSVIKNRRGHLLAFCEARKASRSDKGDIDLVLKRSRDNGRTWSEMEIIWDDQKNTCGNPCPVIDEATGTIWLLLTHNLGKDAERDIIHHKAEGTRTVWVSNSEDDGDTWLVPNNITSSASGTVGAGMPLGPAWEFRSNMGRTRAGW